MAGRVYNALGGTPDSPCPTTGGAEFCSVADVRSWREAAARLYDRAILPTWQALLDVSTSQPPEGGQLAQLHDRVSGYAKAYNELEGGGSFFAGKNRERVAAIVALMLQGDELLDDMQTAIMDTGNVVPGVLLPAPPDEPVTKHALSRWFLPAGAVLGGLVVFGLTAAAAVSYYQRRAAGEGPRRGARAA